MPDTVGLDAHHFVVLDKGAEKDGTMIVCGVGGTLLKNPEDLSYMQMEVAEGGLLLMGLEVWKWEKRKMDAETSELEY